MEEIQVLPVNECDDVNDQSNTQAWNSIKKLCHILPFGAIVLAVTMGSSVTSPATKQIEADLGVSQEAAVLSFSVFTLGFGFDPAIAAPLSETYGRSAVYKVTGAAYFAFILGSALTPTFAGLIVCRFFAGCLGGPCVAIAGGTVADMYPEHNRANTMATVMMCGFLGSALGPVIGGFCAVYKGWRWTQWAALIFAGCALLLLVPMEETYKKVILKRLEKKRSPELQSEQQQQTIASFAKNILTNVVLRPMHMLVTEPIVTAFSVYNAFALGTLYGFFSAYSVVLRDVYGFNEWQTGLTSVSTCVGVLLGWITAIIIQRTIHTRKYKRAGASGLAPEHRLYSAMAGSLGIPIGLFWFAWTARPSIHWICPTLAGVPFAFGNLSIFITAALYMVDCYGPLYGASALASNGIVRYTLSAMFPLFSIQMFERLGTAWASSLLGFIGVALLPIPWVFYRYGPRIRSFSKYDKNGS